MPLILIILGCDNPADELSQSWQIDRLRVLAVAAEPAEPRPGDVVSFTSLVVSPVEPVGMVTWFACLPDASNSYGCTGDTDALSALEGVDIENLTPEEQAALYKELVAAGLIGVEPFFSPVWTVPTDALDGLDEAERAEGLSALVSVTAIPAGESVDESDVELAYKRVPVSEAVTPNHNPGVVGWTVDGASVAAGERVTVARGDTAELTLVLADDARETYQFTDDDGAVDERVEEPYLTWYTQAGEFDQTATLDPDFTVEWTAPTEPATPDFSVWAVVRDRRGGMGWAELPLHVE